MPQRFDFITFDCYGTLIDWENGIRDAFQDAATADGVNLDRAAIIPAYASAEPGVQAETYTRYRDVLAASAKRAATRLGWQPSNPDFLADSLAGWKPFADTNRALENLKQSGHRLGILSNIDDDLLEQTRRHFTVDFDLIVTAEQVRSYKPAHAHWERARQFIGNATWLHAAASNFHDIVPTNVLGIPNAWINRKGETQLPGGNPTYEFRDLSELADSLAANRLTDPSSAERLDG